MNTMDGFDTLPVSYLGNPMPVGLLPQTDYLQSTSGVEMQDHLSNFDTETYMRLGDRFCDGTILCYSDRVLVLMT